MIVGLKRTGKSCRLRWLNYLKPDIKRGNLTPQEQLLILELHSKWGNRWSKIAQHLPGRTDNEIKNYWRTKKLSWRWKTWPILKPTTTGRNSAGGERASREKERGRSGLEEEDDGREADIGRERLISFRLEFWKIKTDLKED
ncbi:hypothetical protein V2J09_022641 [Rumex salicifolius]